MVNRLTLHTTLDPDVPFAHEATLASTVATAKTSRWLAQQHYTRYGHCNFSPAEALSAFLGLVAWAETGVKPASGAVGRPEAPSRALFCAERLAKRCDFECAPVGCVRLSRERSALERA